MFGAPSVLPLCVANVIFVSLHRALPPLGDAGSFFSSVGCFVLPLPLLRVVDGRGVVAVDERIFLLCLPMRWRGRFWLAPPFFFLLLLLLL